MLFSPMNEEPNPYALHPKDSKDVGTTVVYVLLRAPTPSI